MFVSLVAELAVPRAVALPLTHGENMQGALFRSLAAIDPEAATRLHGGRDGHLRPYTVSLIQCKGGGGHGQLRVAPEDRPWFRVTGLTAEASQLLLALAERQREWPIYGRDFDARFEIAGWRRSPAEHPWAGAVSLDALCAAAVEAMHSEADRIHLEFLSPTAFEAGSRAGWGAWRHLPEHALVFGSFRDHLEAFCPELAQPPGRGDILEGCLALGRYTARSHILSFALRNHKKRFSFTGDAEYLINPVLPLEAVLWLHLLAGFGFYSGCGVDTGAGMGQVRRIPANRFTYRGRG
jgi:CRISPR-associated endoribonuclease Cas6